MSTLLLWASPDENGLTAAVKDQLLKGLADGGETVTQIHLNRKNIRTCAACGKGGFGSCRTDGTCTIKDDLQGIYDEMIKADGLVIVTPVYWHDMSENFKNLLDRVRRMEASHNRYLKGKRALIAACAGGTGRGTTEALSILRDTLFHMGVEAIDRLAVCRFNAGYMVPAAYEAGKNFARNREAFELHGYHYFD